VGWLRVGSDMGEDRKPEAVGALEDSTGRGNVRRIQEVDAGLVEVELEPAERVLPERIHAAERHQAIRESGDLSCGPVVFCPHSPVGAWLLRRGRRVEEI